MSQARFATQTLNTHQGWRCRKGRWLDDCQELASGHTLDPSFRSEDFLERFLNPEASPGCVEHGQPGCLCDIDVTLSKHLPNDIVPIELADVVDAETLMFAAANIWLNYDLLIEDDKRVREELIEAAEAGELDELLAAIGGAATYHEANKVFPITRFEYTTLRRMLTVGRKKAKPPMPIARIREMIETGYSNSQVYHGLKAETGYCYSKSAISKARSRLGFPPAPNHKGGRRRQYDYDRIVTLWRSGVSSREISDLLNGEGKPCRINTIQDIIREWGDRGPIDAEAAS